jgi:Spy/CpxP family protein refolding chaperone
MVLALGLVALLAAPAQTQAQQRKGAGRGGFGGPGGFGGGGGGVMLLTNKSVQQELKVSDDQASKLDALAQELREKQGEQFRKLQDVPQDERGAKMRELNQAIAADVRKGVGEILKPAQVKRFDQVQLQQIGVLGVGQMPRIQESLKLTDEQKSKLGTIQEEQRAAVGEIMQGGGFNNPETRQKMADLRTKSNEKAMAVLTDSQKTTWNELIGEPFEIRLEGGPGGPGGPGGARRKDQ